MNVLLLLYLKKTILTLSKFMHANAATMTTTSAIKDPLDCDSFSNKSSCNGKTNKFGGR